MTRRRIAVDLCTYRPNTGTDTYCTRKASFSVQGERVCLQHVGHAVEVIRFLNQTGAVVEVNADYERDGGFRLGSDPNGST